MFTLKDILDGNNGAARLLSAAAIDPALVFPAAQHDSRQVGRGDLFVAIKGAQADGHRFIAAAAKAGAGAVLCTKAAEDVAPDFLQIVVPDVVEALRATARVRVRRQQQTTLIGITGSNGKTTTKDAVAQVLGQHFPTLKTYASYNNELGYPLTLLRLEEGHRFAVLEMGAQWVGELTWLCNTIAAPDWSIITNVGAAHLGLFGSQERVSIAKSELVRVLAPSGIAILNYDNPPVRAMRDATAARVLYYGIEEGAEVRGCGIGGDTLLGRHFTLSYHGEKAQLQLRLPGEQGVSIALAAAAAGRAAGLSLNAIASALEGLAPAKGRGEVKRGPNGSTLIDDTYNANRQSIIAITRAMHESQIPPGGRRWVVLGDIFELGQYARDEHCASGAALAGTVDYLIAIGDEARYYVEGAARAQMPADHIYYFAANVENRSELEAAKRAAADLLKSEVRSGDMVLLKASRGMRFETIFDMWQDEQQSAERISS